jgi:hypothetical protein
MNYKTEAIIIILVGRRKTDLFGEDQSNQKAQKVTKLQLDTTKQLSISNSDSVNAK